MDELFLLPSAPIAMPRAYWLNQLFLSSQLIVLEPSHSEWKRIQDTMSQETSGFDMDILNEMYNSSCIILPHRKYNLLSAEFRAENHVKYMGGNGTWDGAGALEEAKFIHFSDWPVPKPWIEAGREVVASHQPRCREVRGVDGVEMDCTDRDIWLGLYDDFSERRKVCLCWCCVGVLLLRRADSILANLWLGGGLMGMEMVRDWYLYDIIG